ncbi:MAG TPA: DUF6457 domain-containing protein [Candidatus Limnocylindria bacterium]|nr:DUF6457 domain-containing protein [Candidatus Limnocylindria bacterium]
MDPQPEAIPLDQWLERLRMALGPADPGIELGIEERGAILELARVAAHRCERIAAPLTAFIVGAGLRDLAQPGRIEMIQAVTKALEATPKGED